MKKRILRYLPLLFIVLLLPLSGAHAETYDTGIITGVNVALRKAPEENAALLSRLETGTFVAVLETNVNAEWHRVSLDGQTGYVRRYYMSLAPSFDSYRGTATGTVVNCETAVNLRKQPATSATVLGTLPLDATVTVIKLHAKPGWHEVRYAGQRGYVSAEYLSLHYTATNEELRTLTCTGGALSPAFTPKEHGYVVKVTDDSVTLTATANDGVAIDIDATGQASTIIDTPRGSVRTVYIALDGEVHYAVTLVRDVLTVGMWNIKRGNGRVVKQSFLIETQQPDILALQEVFLSTFGGIDNMKSIRTAQLRYSHFTPTIRYENGSRYGIGLLSSLRIQDSWDALLTSRQNEQRAVQRIEVLYQGETISIYNTHLSYESTATRLRQLQELLTHLSRDPNPYKILMGDFNTRMWELGGLTGYRILNDRNTVYLGTDAEPFKRTTVDNIIVSNNFTVHGIRMIDTRLSDHKPLFAYLTIEKNPPGAGA